MASEYTYSPRMDFFIERVDRATGFEMPCFHIHHKYEIYYEARAAILSRTPLISSMPAAWC